MPEFSGKQQKLSFYFTKMRKDEVTASQEDIKNEEVKCNSEELVSERKGEKRSLEKCESLTQNQKRPKINGRVKQNMTGQATLKSFFSKPKLDSQQNKVTEIVNKSSCEDMSWKSQAKKQILDCVTFTKSEIKPDENNKEDKKDEQDSHKTSLLKEKTKDTAKAWKNLLGGLGPAPLCKGHNEPCVLRTVKKEGPNKGKQFYVCARGEGLKNNPEARCDFFKWVEKKK